MLLKLALTPWAQEIFLPQPPHCLLTMYYCAKLRYSAFLKVQPCIAYKKHT
jgi:hypothetical protein